MPVLDAKHTGACVGCGALIMQGERIEYTRKEGARHLACTERSSGVRPNTYRATCRLCEAPIGVGKGLVQCIEVEVTGGVYTRRWLVDCSDIEACTERIAARLRPPR